MDNPKYVNHYIDILTGTMTDAVMRNISFQANLKVHEEVVNELQSEIEKLKQFIDDMSVSNQSKTDDLHKQLNDFRGMQSEYNSTRDQIHHLETFKNELVRERQINEELRNENNNLRNDIEELKTPIKKVRKPKEEVLSTQEDGGSF